MKKALFGVVSALLVTVLLAGAVGCSEAGKDLSGEATAYGLVHSHYVGIATVKTDASGKITSVNFDEMQTPYNWAAKKEFKEYNDDEDAFTTGGFGKKIVIGDKTFSAVDESATGYPDYRLVDTNNSVSLENWLKDNLNAKWYVQQVKLGNYGVAKSNGTGVYNTFKDASTGELSVGDRWLKSKNGYWAEGGVGLGWKANMKALCDFVAANGFADEGLTVKGEDKVWKVNGVSTGATLNDFNDYIALCKIAYSMALTE